MPGVRSPGSSAVAAIQAAAPAVPVARAPAALPRKRGRVPGRGGDYSHAAAPAQATAPQPAWRQIDPLGALIYKPARMKIDRARLFDLRVVQRNIRSGRVNKDEYAAYLSALSDTSPKIKPREEGGDEDGYDGHPPPPEPIEPERAAAPQIAPVGPPVEPFAPSAPPAPSTLPPMTAPFAAPVLEARPGTDEPEPDTGG